MLPIDAAAHSSRWRRRHPVDKAVLGLGLTVLAISLPPWPGAALILLTAVAVLLGPAGVPARQLWRAYRVPLGFCVTGAATLLVQVGGPEGFVTLADGGPVRAGELLLRTSAASLGVLLFAFTTPMSDLLPRLVKAGVPAPVVDVALVTYRMSFLLLDSVTPDPGGPGGPARAHHSGRRLALAGGAGGHRVHQGLRPCGPAPGGARRARLRRDPARPGTRRPCLRPVRVRERHPARGPDRADLRPGKALFMSDPVLLALRGASFAYEDGPAVLSGLDFEARPGARSPCSAGTAVERPR